MPETLPKSFRDTFARLRKRLHEMYLLQWALVAIGGLLLALLAFALLDRAFFIPEWFRLVFFLLGFLGLLTVGPWRYFSKAYFQSSNIALAQLIKKSRNRLGDRIQGALEISQRAGRVESPELLQAALEQIGEEITQLELSKVLPKLHHHIYALIIAGLVLVGIGGFCLAPKQATNATQRFFFPIAEVPRYSTIRFAKTPKEYYVVAGKPSELVIKLHEKSLSDQEVLGRGKLSGSPEQTLAYENGFHFSLPSLEKKTTFTIQAGDAYKSIQIIPKPRPRISSLQLRQKLPGYLQLRDRTLKPKGARVEVLEGSQVTVELESSQDLQAVSSSELFAFEHAGKKAWSQQVNATEKVETKLSIQDRYGLQSFPEKTFFMDVVGDRAPSVRLLQVEREFTLLPHETLDLYLSAEDDFGVERIELVLQSLNRPNFMTSSLVKRGTPEAVTLQSSFALNPEVLGITPDSYSLSAAATDYLPEREPTLSALVTLHLLSYEAHANLIKTQFTVLLDQLDEFYQGSLANYFENERVSRAFNQTAEGDEPI